MTTGSIVTPASVFDTAKTTVSAPPAAARRAGACEGARAGVEGARSASVRSKRGSLVFIVCSTFSSPASVGAQGRLREALGDFEQDDDDGDAEQDEEEDVHAAQHEAAARAATQAPHPERSCTVRAFSHRSHLVRGRRKHATNRPRVQARRGGPGRAAAARTLCYSPRD